MTDRDPSTCGAIAMLVWFATSVWADLDEGLVAYYPMEESGVVLRDASGNGNDGKISGPKRADGKFGDGLRFTASDQNAVVPHARSLAVKEEVTVAYWLKPAFVGHGENRVVYKHDSYNIDFFNGHGRFHILTGGAWIGPSAPGAKKLGEWVHFAGTFFDGRLTLYVNGIEVARIAGAGDVGAASEQIGIGGLPWFGLAGVLGSLEELRFYNRGVDPKEVEALVELVPRKGLAVFSPATSLATAWGSFRRS